MDFNNQPKAAALRAKYETTDKSKDIGEWVFGMMLEESGCALLHASAFGLPHDELFYRLSFADFDGGELLKLAHDGSEINEEFVKTNCVKLFKGLDALINWWTVQEVKA